MRKITIALALAGILACSTSPTGRKQLMLLPESQVSSMGVQAFQQMKTQIPTESDPAINTYVKCVVAPVLKQVGDQARVKDWEVVVFRDESANAFALPGGKIGVHTGLLKVAKTDAQLAAVLGHEVGHVIARHGNERVSEQVAAQGGLTAAGLLSRDNPRAGLIMAALGLGAQLGVLLPHSRTQESEADVIGLKLMAQAGFNPRESVDLWKNMMEAGGGGPPEFLSTHPGGNTRIRNLESQMADVLPLYERATQGAGRTECRKPS